MGINLGTSTTANFNLGSTQVNSIWLGNTKVWPTLPPHTDFIVGWESSDVTKFTPNALAAIPFSGSTYYTLAPSSSIKVDAFNFSFVPQTIISASFPSISTIGLKAFWIQNSLKYVFFPNAVGEILLDTFRACISLELIAPSTFPNITSIGETAFSDCTALISVDMPSALFLGVRSFRNDTSLQSVSFANAKTLQNSVFRDCIALTSINLPSLSGSNALGGSPTNNTVFQGVPNIGTITVPSFYATNNAGAPDGDLQYLKTAPRNWTINYI
jgi:hypothetical protein